MSGYGGGHLAGTGRRGAAEFPVGWSREEITERLLDVALHPGELPRRLPHGPWHTVGVRAGVRIVVLLEGNGGVRAAFPVDGPGVRHNPDRAADPARPTAADLAAARAGHAASVLVAEVADRLSAADAVLCAQLLEAGEWDELGLLLGAALPAGTLSAEHQKLLDVLL